MKKLFFLFVIMIITCYSYGQNTVSCDYLADSIDVIPDTIYITEGVDTVIQIDFMNSSHIDLSYAFLWITMEDTSFIEINDTTATGGLTSPFPFPWTWEAKLDYKTTSIPLNTVVKATFYVWNGKIDTPIYNGCELPLIFIINSTIVSNTAPNNSKQFRSISPNPLVDQSIIKLRQFPEKPYQIVAYDLYGSEVFHSKSLISQEYVLDRNNFSSPGIYFIFLQQENGQVADAMKFMVH